MKLILHAGAHKTGTTMIQQALAVLEPELAKRGVRYVDYHALKQPELLSYLHPAQEQPERRAVVKAFFENLATTYPDDTLLLSTESVFSFANLWKVAPERQFYGDISHSAQRLADLGVFEDTRILYYLRRQDRFLNSVYLEYVKGGNIDVPFEEFYPEVPVHKLSWKKLLDTMASVYGDDHLDVVLFEDIKRGGHQYLRDFLRRVGVPDLAPPDIDFAAGNRSLPMAAYEEAIVAFPGLEPAERRALGRRLQRQFSGKEQAPAEFITPELREEIMAPHREDNRALLARYLHTDVDEYGYTA